MPWLSGWTFFFFFARMRGGQNYFYLFYMRCLCLVLSNKQPESEQTFFRAYSPYYQAAYCTGSRYCRGPKPLKRQATVSLRTTMGGGKSVSDPIWIPTRASNMQRKWVFCGPVCPLSHWAVLSKSTLVTLDLSCMEVRVLGPAEVDWADNRKWMHSGKSHTQATLISHTGFEWPLKKDPELLSSNSLGHLENTPVDCFFFLMLATHLIYNQLLLVFLSAH